MSRTFFSYIRACMRCQRKAFPWTPTCSKLHIGLGVNCVVTGGGRSIFIRHRVTYFPKCLGYSNEALGRSRLIHSSQTNPPVVGRSSNTLIEIHLPVLHFITMLKGPKAKFTVSIEGNIGSGKSTLLNHFSKFSDVQILHEPVEKWRDVRGHNLLGRDPNANSANRAGHEHQSIHIQELMYKDPCRWSHTFQTFVQMTMLELQLKPCTVPVKLIERSLFSGRYCFVENLYRSEMMSGPEYAVYCEWYKMITQNLDVGLDLIVYLQTDPSLLHNRIKKRARSEEKTIPLQYLEDLHKLHEEWLIEKKHGLSTPVLVLDANDSLPSMYRKFEEHTSDILCRKITKSQNEDHNLTGEVNVSPSSHALARLTN